MDNKESTDKLAKWLEMDYEEKLKWNGYEGFLIGETFKDNNQFRIDYKRKTMHKAQSEKERREKSKNEK
jgi:hypothetical protein